MNTTVSADGTVIAYETTGEGPAVVLIGGAFSSRTDTITTGLANTLAAHLSVVTYDRRGRGDSGDTRPYAAKREIEDLEALVASVGEPVMVFGGSSGAALALEAAAEGVAMRKLAVFEPPYVTDPRRAPLPSHHELAALVEQGRRGDAVELFLTRGADLAAQVVAGMRDLPCRAAMEAAAHTLGYDVALVGPGPVPERRLASVVVPALVLAGADSSPRTRHAAEAVTKAVPDAALTLLHGPTHGRLDPAVLAAALVPFFTG